MKDGTEHKGDSNADVNSKSCLCLQQLLPFLGVKKLKSGEINHQDDERTLIKVVPGTMISLMVTQQIRCKSYMKIQIQIFLRMCQTEGCNSKGALEIL